MQYKVCQQSGSHSQYTLDRNGVLTGPRNSQLMLTLDQDGYLTK